MYNHKEAFCLMTYRCKDCGFEERIWNSRDGVTPFGLACPSCKGHDHVHADWQNDRCNPLFGLFMQPGQRLRQLGAQMSGARHVLDSCH